jgi:DinB family protein
MPDTAQYLARIREQAGDADPLEVQARTADELGTLISGATDETLHTRPLPNKWSVGEILAHLAEDEIATAWRYRQMVEHSGLDLDSFDQDLWAKWGHYEARSPHDSLMLFRLLREANLMFLRGLTPEQWACDGIHAERGRITVRELATHMAGHDANHLQQVRRILGR